MYKSYIRVNTIDEAISKLNKHQNSSKIIAGGTDIMIQLRNNYKKIDLLVDVSQVSALKSIKRDRNKIIIGSAVTFSEIIESNILQQEIPILIEACRKIGAPQIRNMGTIGGNICTASGAADMVPCLFALNAQVVLVSTRGKRKLPIHEFMLSNRKTIIESDELLKEVIINRLSQSTTTAFLKMGLRASQAISVLNIAVVIEFESNIMSNAIVVVGCAGPKAIICKEASNILKGRIPSEELFINAAELAIKEISPIDDIRGSAEYRNYLAKTLVYRAINKAYKNHRLEN